MAAEAQFAAGDNVFFNHPKESWVLAVVKGSTPNPAINSRTSAGKKLSPHFYEVETNDQEREIPKNEPFKKVDEWNLELCPDLNLANKTVDDLLNLTNLHDSTLLRCLFLRYMNDVVYTNIGAIVVALNPFNFKIPHYMDDQMGKYLAETGQMITEKLLPHSWAQAHNTFVEMTVTQGNQCILISGESGAGKTEATKIVMKYLSKISVLGGTGEEKKTAERVAQSLAACSPVLESFGNARTVRNDNSSRFGKLMKVKFSKPQYLLKGAFTIKYLLEKSRIITCAENERCYHSFYLALRSKEARKDYGFDLDISQYKSVNSGHCLDNKEYSTVDDYHEVVAAMALLGIQGEVLTSVWQCASAIVHQCNVIFQPEGEGSHLEESSKPFLDTACKLWGISTSELLEEYIAQILTVAGESTRKLQPVHKAYDSRDALSKFTYDHLFGWLVEKCNDACDAPGEDDIYIALLDIFGFEDFEHNSFEQLCINLANETLQNHYNTYIFTKDIEQCKAEGIDTVEIKCPDNKPCLQLIHDAFKLLDDQCSTGSGTYIKFFENVESKYEKNAFYLKRPLKKHHFGIHHYAADVTYDTVGWLEKNRDTLRDTIKIIMSKSTKPLVAMLFKESVANLSASSAKATVSGYFKSQLISLMTVIESTNPHWIRCVKPHPAKKPKMFGGLYTVLQLESSGVLGTVKIRKAGYPVRWPHSRFCIHYKPILPMQGIFNISALSQEALKTHSEQLLAKAGFNENRYAQVGKTLVFLKADVYPLLEKKRNHALKQHALMIQRVGKGFRGRRRLFRAGQAMIIQRAGRGILSRGELFNLYLDKNRERLRAIAKEKERLRLEQVEFEKKQREQRVEMDRVEVGARSKWVEEWKEDSETLLQKFFKGRRRIEEDAKDAKAAELRRQEEERLKQLAEIAWRQFHEALEPMNEEMREGKELIKKEEQDMREVLAFACWKSSLSVIFRGKAKQLELQETQHRRLLRVDMMELSVKNEEAHEECMRKLHVFHVTRELYQSLEDNRDRRRRKEREWEENVKEAPRSYVESAMLTGLHDVLEHCVVPKGELSPTPAMTKASSAVIPNLQTKAKNIALTETGVEGQQPQWKLTNTLLPEEVQHMLFSKIEGSSPYRAEHAQDAVQRERALVSAQRQKDVRKHYHDERAMDSVTAVTLEVGQRVYVPSYSQMGTVLRQMQDSVRPVFLVRLEEQQNMGERGTQVWLELDDVELRVSQLPGGGLGDTEELIVPPGGKAPKTFSRFSAAVHADGKKEGSKGYPKAHHHYQDPNVVTGTGRSISSTTRQGSSSSSPVPHPGHYASSNKSQKGNTTASSSGTSGASVAFNSWKKTMSMLEDVP